MGLGLQTTQITDNTDYRQQKTSQVHLRGFFHAPEKIRTPDTTVRSRMLYPAELLTHAAACLSLTAQELLYPLWR